MTQDTTFYMLSHLAKHLHETAKEKGWYDKEETDDAFLERTCNNLHDEISELHEAWRNGALHDPCDKADKMRAEGLRELTCLQEELADIVIRALDTAVRLNVDIGLAVAIKAAFNQTRPYRHGGKKS